MFDKLTSMGALAIIGTSFSGYLFAENFLTPSPENWNLFVEVSLTMAALMVVKYAWEWFTQRRDQKVYREWNGRTVVVPVWRDEPSPFEAEVLGLTFSPNCKPFLKVRSLSTGRVHLVQPSFTQGLAEEKIPRT